MKGKTTKNETCEKSVCRGFFQLMYLGFSDSNKFI